MTNHDPAINELAEGMFDVRATLERHRERIDTLTQQVWSLDERLTKALERLDALERFRNRVMNEGWGR